MWCTFAKGNPVISKLLKLSEQIRERESSGLSTNLTGQVREGILNGCFTVRLTILVYILGQGFITFFLRLPYFSSLHFIK